MRKLAFLSLLLVSLACAAPAGAQEYPGKPVRLVVSWAAGAAADFVARVVGQQLGQQTNQAFVVENRTGASGTIGTSLVAKAPPDGYTLNVVETSFAMVPSLKKSLPYDALRDFTPITQLVRAPMVLVVHPSVPAKTVPELVELARAQPGKLNYGSAGTGTPNHLAAELLKAATKVSIGHVPYRGGGDTVAGLLGGQVDMLITTVPNVAAHIKSGKLRALAVTTAKGKRAPSMPEVPSFADSGIAGMEIYTWSGLVGPAGMPADIVQKLQGEAAKALALSSVRQQLLSQESEAVGSSPEAFAELIRSETHRWKGVVESAGILPD